MSMPARAAPGSRLSHWSLYNEFPKQTGDLCLPFSSPGSRTAFLHVPLMQGRWAEKASTSLPKQPMVSKDKHVSAVSLTLNCGSIPEKFIEAYGKDTE